MDQALHRLATKEREKIKRTTKQRMESWHSKGGNHLEQDGDGQTTMEGIDGGLHPAGDGQGLCEVKYTVITRLNTGWKLALL